MSAENISIDYEKIKQLSSDINTADAGGFSETITAYEKLTDHMTKSAGAMLEAIKEQTKAEKELTQTIARTYIKLVKSMDVAAQSLENIDESMTTKMN